MVRQIGQTRTVLFFVLGHKYVVITGFHDILLRGLDLQGTIFHFESGEHIVNLYGIWKGSRQRMFPQVRGRIIQTRALTNFSVSPG